MVKLGRKVPIASMDNGGKIIWAKHNEIQTVNIKSVGADFEVWNGFICNLLLIIKLFLVWPQLCAFFASQVTDGERLPLAVKEMGTCDLYPQVSYFTSAFEFSVYFVMNWLELFLYLIKNL